MNDLPFSKKRQAQKPKKKEKIELTRKDEKLQERSDQHDLDKLIYDQIAERSFDWVEQCHMCEWCRKAQAVHMHHILGGSQRRTTLENVIHICLQCHNERGHHLH